MSWLATRAPLRALGDALALRPDLLAGYRAFEAEAAAAGVIDPEVRASYRRRIATLIRGPGEGADGGCGAALPARAAVAVEFAEQFVLDPHGVTDELVGRLRAHFATREIVAMAQDVAVAEGLARLARMLDVAPEL